MPGPGIWGAGTVPIVRWSRRPLYAKQQLYDYYISPTGDNGNPGTYAEPWATLAYALTQMSAGESLGVMDGTYVQNNTSSALANITIAAAPAATPVFLFADKIGTWAKTDGYTNVYDKTTSEVFGAWDDATKLAKQTSIANVDATENSWYYTGGVCYVHITAGADPDTVGGLYCAQSANYHLTLSGANITLRGLTFYYGMRVLNLTGAAPTVEQCTISHVAAISDPFWGITLTGDGGAVCNSTLSDFFSGASKLIYCTNTSANTTVSDCTLSGPGRAVCIQGGAGHVITRCELIASGGFYSIGGTAVISYCFGRDSTAVLACASRAGTVQTLHHCMVYYEVGDTGYYSIVAELGAEAYWYHNVVANLKRTAAGMAAYYVQSTGTVATVYNCVAYNCQTGFKSLNDASVKIADYNGAYANTTQYSWWTPGAHDVTDDPLFTDPDNDDFTLQAGSPLIDAGVGVAGINDGYLGDAPDIGRWEKA